jgi:phage baseplate assembly protein W
MAIVIDRKNTLDLIENERVAIGITLTLQRGSNGYFSQSFQTKDQVKSNIKNLILTSKGERLMQPDFGTNLYDVLFSQNTDDLEQSIQDSIEDAISIWMPYINIVEIFVDQNNTNIDRNIFAVSLKYQISGQQTLETVTFNVG